MAGGGGELFALRVSLVGEFFAERLYQLLVQRAEVGGGADDVKIYGAGDDGLGGAFGLLVVAAEGADVLLGFDRLEIDEPAFEDGLGDLFEGLVGLVV